MRPTRLRIRTMMVAVAIVALLLGAAAYVRRSRGRAGEFRARAMAHLWRASMEEMSMAPWEPPGYHVPIPNPSRAAIERSKRRAAYHYSMAEKHGRAERHPWMPLWPDPPEPE